MDRMKVAVSVLGRFHGFDLAQQLEKRGALTQLLTSYPAFAAARFGVPRQKVTSNPLFEVLSRAWFRLPQAVQRRWNPQAFKAKAYDAWAAKHLDPQAELFVGWSNSSLASLQRAKANGAKTILERGSTHILFQTKVLKEEYEHWGLRFDFTPPETIERELQEYNEADRISVPTEFVKQTFVSNGIPAAKILKTPYGIRLSQFERKPRHDEVFRVMFCGALSIRKGVPRLLKAFTELKLANAELCLVGSVTDEIKPFLEKFRSPQIVVHGSQPQEKLAEFYSQASLFCLPSLEEGMAMVIPQAMACGLPVVCTAESGAGEVVTEGKEGFFVASRDEEALGTALEKCYRAPELLEEMGKAAKTRISNAFTWDHYGEKMLAHYQDLLEGSSRKAARR